MVDFFRINLNYTRLQESFLITPEFIKHGVIQP